MDIKSPKEYESCPTTILTPGHDDTFVALKYTWGDLTLYAHALETPIRRIAEMITDLSRLCFMFFILAIGYWQLAMGRLLYALRFYSGFADLIQGGYNSSNDSAT
ncbi:MAG: hypothetical protein IKV31_05285 [Paludibacteraceae bacterium]|nr:hypothetical protein [Paludibacteraceae bacterium]